MNTFDSLNCTTYYQRYNLFSNFENCSELGENYQPHIWTYNGPLLFTRVMQKICQVDNISKMEGKNCSGVQIHPAERFYPLLWGRELRYLFDPARKEQVLNQTRTNNVMGHHFWYCISKKVEKFTMRTGSAYDVIANQYCPLIYDQNLNF